MAKKQIMGAEIYHGTADFGKTTAVISAVIGTIVCIVLIGFGIYVLVHKSKHTATAVGTVDSATCNPFFTDNYLPQYNCTLRITYDHQEHTIKDSSSAISYNPGDSVSVYYDPNNPSDASLERDIPKVVGWVLITTAVVVLIGLWIWVYVIQKSETVGGGDARGARLGHH